MATKNSPGPKTYRALRRTWLSHESRMVEAGEVFKTEFPQVPKREEEAVMVPDADGRMVLRRAPRDPNAEPEMVDMALGDNIVLAEGDKEVSEPAIGLEHGDKKPDVEAVLKSAQDHIDRQRASLPSPGLPRMESAEPQRAMDGPATRETDDDRDGRKTPAQQRAEQQRRDAERADAERRSEAPQKGPRG